MTKRVYLDLVPADFPDFFDGWGDDQFTRNLKDGLFSAIEQCFVNALGEGTVLQVNPSKYMSFNCIERGISKSISIKQIVESGGFSVSSASLEVDVAKGSLPDGLHIVSGKNIWFSHWLEGVDAQPKVTYKPMKRFDRFKIKFLTIEVASLATPFMTETYADCACPPENIKPEPGYAFLRFKCFVCAKRYLCECFRGIAEHAISRPNYNTEPFEKLLKTSEYKEAICHLCRDIPSTTIFDHGGKTEAERCYSIYANSFRYLPEFNAREFYGKIRDKLGIPRVGEGWVSEMNLFRIVQSLYPEHEVIHQGSPDWLGRQRFDVYVPNLKLALEYNGQQHYFPISHFGGQEGLEATQKRDKKKRAKARKAGVSIIEFRYDETITPASVKKRISRGHLY
jgi:hypothetical protein